MEKKLGSRDFILVVIGQIISLFGNAILRFALPLYLLQQSGSAALFGVISACAFIPMIILSPIGGILADRVNKRNIMVILDYSTAGITFLLALLLGQMNLVVLLLISLVLLYGIQGAYQPTVQASIPALVPEDKLMVGNAVINLVNSLSNLLGPILGGVLFAFYEIMPILVISIICFLFSATMELFIRIPFNQQEKRGGIVEIGVADFKESFRFIKVEQPSIWKVSLVVAGMNLFVSALIIIGLPIIITGYLGFEEVVGNQLYGYAQGAIGVGSLIGGMMAGVLASRLKLKDCPLLLSICTLALIPIGIVLQRGATGMMAYVVILISCILMMAVATLFTIQMMALLQQLTPSHLIGKVIACVMCISMCAQPIGQALYGVLFQGMAEQVYIPVYLAVGVTLMICIGSIKLFKGLDEQNTKGIEETYREGKETTL